MNIKIKNMTIGFRLGLGFGMVIFLTMFVGLTALTQMHNLAQLTDDMYKHPLAVSNTLRDIKADVISIHNYMNEIVNTREEENVRAAANRVSDKENKILQSFAFVKERFLGDQADIDAAQKIYSDWKRLCDNVIHLVLSNHREKAVKLKKNEGDHFVVALDHSMQKLIDFANTKSNRFYQTAVTTKERTQLIMSVLLLVILLTGVWVSWLTARRIAKPLKNMTVAARSIALGDIEQEVDYRGTDEIGKLADSFREMIKLHKIKTEMANQISLGNLAVEFENISEKDVLGRAIERIKENLLAMQSDLQTTIDLQKKGNLEARCNPANFAGAYAELLKGINDSLDAVINPIDTTIVILKEYAAGNLSKEMHDLPGKQQELTNSLNGIRHNLNALISESKRLAKAGEQGNLQVRGNAENFSGSYREIIQGLNLALENNLKPINEAIASLTEMANGNLSVTMNGDYHGDHAAMKRAMNTTLRNLNEILDQISVMIQQVTAGAGQVADASQLLSQGATKQASSLEEVTASMNEIGSQTRQNAENAKKVNEIAISNRENAEVVTLRWRICSMQ